MKSKIKELAPGSSVDLNGGQSNQENQLEKDYESILDSGNTMKIHISAIINGNKKGDSRQVLKKMAECSHDFYLELGTWLNNKPL